MDMYSILATLMVGLCTNAPIDTLPPKKKSEDMPIVYAVNSDRRIILWRKLVKQHGRKHYYTEVTYEPVCIN